MDMNQTLIIGAAAVIVAMIVGALLHRWIASLPAGTTVAAEVTAVEAKFKGFEAKAKSGIASMLDAALEELTDESSEDAAEKAIAKSRSAKRALLSTTLQRLQAHQPTPAAAAPAVPAATA